MGEPRVGQTKMAGGSTIQVNPDGSTSYSGETRREMIYLGRKASRETGRSSEGRPGWYDYTPKTAEAANRSARIASNKNNEIRAGRATYRKGGAKSSYGGQLGTAKARSKRNNTLAKVRRMTNP